MKKLLLLFFAVVSLFVFINAQELFYVYYSDGTNESFSAISVDSISLIAPDEISALPVSKSFGSTGGTFDIAVASNTSWTASSNQTWATLSATSGSGDGIVTITVAPNASVAADTAVITFITQQGKLSAVTIHRKSVVSPTMDVCGHTYPVVKIGNQLWLAENLKCNKYDTKSEAYNASWLINNTIPTSDSEVYTPYFTDASDKSKWSSTTSSGNLTDAQVAKLGYLYNWAAAVGIADGQQQTTGFASKRQGICPNGWYMPTDDDWIILRTFIDPHGSELKNNAGTHLKTTSGWYSEDTYYIPGLDTYGFAALPAGYVGGSSVSYIGSFTFFWTATPGFRSNQLARYRSLGNVSEVLNDYSFIGKERGSSVRCMKYTEEISVNPTLNAMDSAGGTVDISITSNTSWTATSDHSWVTLSSSTGSGDGIITITVAPSTTDTSDNATIMFTTPNGQQASVVISRRIDVSPITDICGQTYPVVEIGNQIWMAENLKCNKYDTESEAYNATWLTNNTIPTSSSVEYTPYYTDASDKSKWSSTTFSGNLTDMQVAKLGYLYNWAAVVGVENGTNQTTAFTGNRQGICPNGWHVPSKVEWDSLYDYIYNSQCLISNRVGNYLKTMSGWYDNGNGTDTYVFAALPAGCSKGNGNSSVGGNTYFWTATPKDNGYVCAYDMYIDGDSEYLRCSYSPEKNIGRSVRCLRD